MTAYDLLIDVRVNFVSANTQEMGCYVAYE
jgi:hypothetical protein